MTAVAAVLVYESEEAAMPHLDTDAKALFGADAALGAGFLT
jgi:hypothetical protein